jgi:hypothetical protein
MGGCTRFVLNLSIGRKFRATLGAPPIYRFSDESGTHPFLAMRHFDEPAFKISDPAGVAAFCVRPDRELGEAKYFAQIITSDEYFGGIPAITGEEARYFRSMFARRCRPKRLTHPLPGNGVILLNGSYQYLNRHGDGQCIAGGGCRPAQKKSPNGCT